MDSSEGRRVLGPHGFRQLSSPHGAFLSTTCINTRNNLPWVLGFHLPILWAELKKTKNTDLQVRASTGLFMRRQGHLVWRACDYFDSFPNSPPSQAKADSPGIGSWKTEVWGCGCVQSFSSSFTGQPDVRPLKLRTGNSRLQIAVFSLKCLLQN
jgi:hypothetical protein